MMMVTKEFRIYTNAFSNFYVSAVFSYDSRVIPELNHGAFSQELVPYNFPLVVLRATSNLSFYL
jgi:hypothetical protein